MPFGVFGPSFWTRLISFELLWMLLAICAMPCIIANFTSSPTIYDDRVIFKAVSISAGIRDMQNRVSVTSSKKINLMGYGFKMPRIYTSPVSTLMIDFQSIWNWPLKLCIGNPVRQTGLPVVPCPTVSIFINPCAPRPASISTEFQRQFFSSHIKRFVRLLFHTELSPQIDFKVNHIYGDTY